MSELKEGDRVYFVRDWKVWTAIYCGDCIYYQGYATCGDARSYGDGSWSLESDYMPQEANSLHPKLSGAVRELNEMLVARQKELMTIKEFEG